ncbi:MAG: hypothetical protein A3K18_30465 [Lentisphaerae bacterium RIFOXYA12_64_32]|nr:MAG: hypothetical protein A3K18_30465 [Lentisphaerae bacterium RIFOXYA12_64_32]
MVKIERQMQGWTCVGQHLACAFCHADLGPVEDSTPGEQARQKSAERLCKAANLFGEAVPSKPANPLITDAAGKARFCRDCRQFLKHPFISRCLLHDRRVESMDDCPDFERAAIAESGETPPAT